MLQHTSFCSTCGQRNHLFKIGLRTYMYSSAMRIPQLIDCKAPLWRHSYVTAPDVPTTVRTHPNKIRYMYFTCAVRRLFVSWRLPQWQIPRTTGGFLPLIRGVSNFFSPISRSTPWLSPPVIIQASNFNNFLLFLFTPYLSSMPINLGVMPTTSVVTV